MVQTIGSVRQWLRDRDNLWFLALALACLVPIWAFRYFPSQDGPVHVENCRIIMEYHRPDRAAFREYYELNPRLELTWLGHLVLVGLMWVAPERVAEKILLSGYVLLLPLAIRYALRSVRPRLPAMDRGECGRGLRAPRGAETPRPQPQPAPRGAETPRPQPPPVPDGAADDDEVGHAERSRGISPGAGEKRDSSTTQGSARNDRVRGPGPPHAEAGDAGWLALLGFPFIYNYTLHMGFFSFCYSLALFFFVVGYWLRHRERLTVGRWAGLSALCVLLCFYHPVSLVMACLAVGVSMVWSALAAALGEAGPGRPNWRRFLLVTRHASRITWSQAWPFALALLPAAVLLVSFTSRQGGATLRAPSLRELVLLAVRPLFSFTMAEAGLSVLVTCLFAGLAAVTLATRQRRSDGFAVAALLAVVVYLVAPKAFSGGSFIPPRLTLYPFFLAILWLGAHEHARWVRRAAKVGATGITLALLGILTVKYAELNRDLEEYLSVEPLIEANSTVLPISYAHRGITPDGRLQTQKICTFAHPAAYIASRKGLVDFMNYEACVGYFPVLFRPKFQPFVHIGRKGEFGTEGPNVDFLTYPERMGGRVDYVLVWGAPRGEHDAAAAASVRRQLDAAYDLVFTSRPRGLMRLYRRKPAGLSTRPQ
ncbi:MAG: hypothetical protein FJ290_00340 [Planctomycetes bacterium]|nr:hypothetical protein [Planctomycetota bacterium]